MGRSFRRIAASGFWQNITSYKAIITGILVCCAALLALVWADAFHKVQAERETELSEASKQLDGLACSFEEHAVNTIKHADQMLWLVKSQYEQDRRTTDVFQQIKRAGLVAKPIVLLSTADENGDLRTSNQEPFVFSNIKDREHFRIHQTSRSYGLFISDPVLGRSSGQWTVQVTRRLEYPDGSFGGVAVASLSPLYFSDFYKSVDLGDDAVIALIKTNGTVESWESGRKTVSSKAPQRVDSTLMRQAADEAGQYDGDIAADGVKRIYRYRALKEYPLIVLVGMTEKQALLNLEPMRRKYITQAALLTGLILILCGVWIRVVLYRKRAVELQLALYRISGTVSSSKNLDELYPAVYRIVSGLIRANHFYIALYDRPRNQLLFSYRVDENNSIPERVEFSQGLTEYVIRTGKACYADSKTISRLKARGEITDPRICFTQWVGVPLKNSAGIVFGAMAVFTTGSKASYKRKEQKMLLFVSNQIAMAIERRQMEDELAKSRERYQLAMEGANEGLWDYDLVKDELYYSERIAEMTGIAPDQVLSMDDFAKKIISPEDCLRMREARIALQAGRTAYYIGEYRLLKPPGDSWVYIRGKPVYDKTGRPIRIIGSAVDITERKAMELELKRKNAQLDDLNGQIRRDLTWAAQVQQNSLPPDFTGPAVRVQSVYLPYRIISGDFINYQWREKTKQLRGYIVDVSGHGMAPALQMAALKMLLDSKLFDDKKIDEDDLQAMNRSMGQYLYQESFAGLLYFEFDFPSAMLTVISAGIQFFLAAKPDGGELVPMFSGYMGMFDQAEIQTKHMPFKPGEIYCMMSDGVSDLIEMQGIEKQQGLAAYMSWLDRLAKSPERSDDFSAICIEILPEPDVSIIDIAAGEALEPALEKLSVLLERIAPDYAAMLEMAVNEAINNGLCAGGRVRVTIRRLGNRIVIRVRDDGPGFPNDGVNDQIRGAMTDENFDTKFDEINLAENGRGILLMKMVTDRLLYNAAGNEVLLMKQLDHRERTS